MRHMKGSDDRQRVALAHMHVNVSFEVNWRAARPISITNGRYVCSTLFRQPQISGARRVQITSTIDLPNEAS